MRKHANKRISACGNMAKMQPPPLFRRNARIRSTRFYIGAGTQSRSRSRNDPGFCRLRRRAAAGALARRGSDRGQFRDQFEEGSELSHPAGDGVSETGLIESASTDAGNRRDLAAESMFEYGSRVGWWRLYRIFTGFQIPVTLFACARALEANPPAAQAIAATDWDICGHGYRWIKHYELGEADEREQITKAVGLIRETTGKPTLGWYCRYAPSENTRRLVAEHGGFMYDSDAYNDELPYWVRVADKRHLVIPYSLTTNDVKFSRGVFGSGED